jgi:hypothetical protein
MTYAGWPDYRRSQGWAIVVPLTVYAVPGSSRRLSVGPESTTAVMTAADTSLSRLLAAARPGTV